MAADKSRATRRGGGPATASGKAKSSRNAVQHGLRGAGPANAFELDAMRLKVAELTAHYRPQSPLAVLQIQRIARCAVKLETLYAVEQAKQDLAHLQAPVSDAHVMAYFSHYPCRARVLALLALQPVKPPPPLGLTDRLLEQLCHEIDAFSGTVHAEADLLQNYPKLGKFLQATVLHGYQGPFSFEHRIGVVANRLRAHTDANALLNPSASPSQYTQGDIDKFLLKINLDYQAQAYQTTGKRPPDPSQSFDAAIKLDLAVFKAHWQARLLARDIVAQFARMKSLLAATITMPSEDSDRLMRYQTALEKQLSRYMGELLQLQAIQPAQ